MIFSIIHLIRNNMFPFEERCGLQLVKELVSDDPNLSRIYGFILYTDKDPYVAKVLADSFFWKSLDAISGCNWPIFAVRPLKRGSYKTKNSNPSTISMLVQTWDEPRENIPILKDFGMKDSDSLPLFIAFMWDDNDELQQLSVPIEGSDIDSTYRYIESIVKTISSVENSILPDFKRTVNVFRNVSLELNALMLRNTIKKRGKLFRDIADFFSMFLKKV